jgi:ribosomal protein L35AE/L33A
MLLFSMQVESVYSQNFNPKEIDTLSIFPMNFGLKTANFDQIKDKYGGTFIAVKFDQAQFYNPNNKKNESMVDYYYIFSQKGENRIIWGLVTKNYIEGNNGQVIYTIDIPVEGKILGLSHEVIEYPLSISFFAEEKETGKSYVTETYVFLGFDIESKNLKVIPMEY